MKTALRDWQQEALQEWLNHNKVGTVTAATGSGKTILGVAALKHIGTISPGVDGVLIAVPTIFLQNQWKKVLLEEGFWEADIGFVGNGCMELTKPITIAVVNSIRDIVLNRKLLVLDEFHRYGSIQNFRFIDRGSFQCILGFSATPKREDGEHEKLLAIAPEIYRLGQKESVDKQYLCPFELANVGVDLTPEEAEQYIAANSTIQEAMKVFGDFESIKNSIYAGGATSTFAAAAMKAIQTRRKILLNSEAKINEAPLVVVNESNGHVPKTLVFCEYIAMADKVAERMEKFGFPTAIYHSGIPVKKREQMLEDFKNNKYTIMVTAKALDEGVDVPDCELGIILGGTKVKRQMIQRLGRILRNRPGKKARMYQFYVRGTKDYDWLVKRSNELGKAAEKVIWR